MREMKISIPFSDKTEAKRKPRSIKRSKRRVICILEEAEVKGMEYALSHDYNSWVYVIMKKYNLESSRFEVDSNTRELYYPN